MLVSQTKHTFCRICEATCGLEVEVEDNRIIAIEPDRQHVVSKGFVCVKGTRFADVQHSPDRITAPMKRVGEQWQEISWKQALDEIAEALQPYYQPDTPIDPDFPEAYFGIGLLFYTLGDDENAVRYYLRSLEKNPRDADTRNNLGLIYYRQGELADAREQIEEAIRLQPDFPDAF